MYILRIDDASEYMDIKKWTRIEELLDKYNIKPIVGIIPDNKDKSLIEKYKKDQDFWKKAKKWKNKGWTIALHGCNHEYITNDGGINPVNRRSEFAGVSYEEQCRKIENGIKILEKYEMYPEIFFAPSHTFDLNTIKALREKSNIRIISDTIANDVYYKDDMYFIPQQSGKVRTLPFKIVTFCYHPNIMEEKDFNILKDFLNKHNKKFITVKEIKLKKRKLNIIDNMLRKLYFINKK